MRSDKKRGSSEAKKDMKEMRKNIQLFLFPVGVDQTLYRTLGWMFLFKATKREVMNSYIFFNRFPKECLAAGTLLVYSYCILNNKTNDITLLLKHICDPCDFQDDPFWTVHSLSPHEKDLIANQSVCSLEQLLKLASYHNSTVVFRLRRPPPEHPCYDSWINDTLQAVQQSGVPQSLVSI